MALWDLPHRWGGPVLAWEILRIERRGWLKSLFFGFLLFNLIYFGFRYTQFQHQREQFWQARYAQYGPSTGQPGFYLGVNDQRRLLARSLGYVKHENEARLLFAASALTSFFRIQLTFLLLLTPGLAAAALGHEKERDTLTALFGTELGDWEIVRGKLLGRMYVMMKLMSFGMPFAFLLAGVAAVPFWIVVLCYVQAIVLMGCMVSICILSSIVTRRTRDAIMACYSFMIIIALIVLAALGDDPLPRWLNPVEVVVGLTTPPFTNIKPSIYLLQLGSFGLLALCCYWASKRWLRWASLRQMETRSVRWRWGFRGDIGKDPLRWRERHIIGVAPIQALRMIPSWLGWAGAFTCSLMFVLATINMKSHGNILRYFTGQEWSQLTAAFRNMSSDTIATETAMLGGILVVLSGLVVLFRCAGAVTEEKRRKTWDDLVMTGTRVSKMVESKRKGILDAAMPYLLLYALPIFGFGLCGRTGGFMAALITFCMAWLAVYLGSLIGIALSASQEDTRASC